MKKIIITILLALTSMGVFAQPVIESHEVYRIGAHYISRLEFVSSQVLDTGNIGPNVHWMYPSLTYTLEDTLDIILPTQSLYGSVLPGDRVISRNSGAVNSHYLLHSTNMTQSTGNAGFGTAIPKKPFEVIAQFPFTYGQAQADSFISEFSFFLGANLGLPYNVDSVRRKSYTQYNYIVDGYGTLRTPF